MNLTLQKIILTMLLFISPKVFAGSMTAEIDKQRSTMDEPFWLTVSIQGSLDSDVLVPVSNDFEIVRTGESTNISIVNGTITKERQYTYQVRALKEGSLTIPSLKATVDKEELQTEPISVEVKGGVAPPSQNDVASNKKLVFVERELPKTTLYEGEVVISKVRLLTRARLTGATPSRDAAPDWRLIPVEGQRNTEVTRDGIRWNAIELNEGLIPLRAGKLKAPAFGITATWIQPAAPRKGSPRSVFDMFQGGAFNMGEEVSKKLLSDAVDVLVKPLPSPRPADFSDMVGAFSVSSNVSKRSLNVGETATVTIEVKGQGALDRMRDLKLNIAGARVYADKPSLAEKIESGAGLVSTRVFKFAVVPNITGNLELGTVKLSSFNPFTETYDSLTANLGTLAIGAGATQQGSTATASGGTSDTSPPKETPATTNHNQEVSPSNAPLDLSPKALGEGSEKKARPWYLGPVALGLEFLLLAGILATLMVRRGWRKMQASAPAVSSLQRDHISSVLKDLDGNQPEVTDRAIRALKESLAGAGQDPAAMTSRDLIHNAEVQNFDAVQIETLRRVLAEIDRREYSGDTSNSVESSLISDLKTLLTYCQARNV